MFFRTPLMCFSGKGFVRQTAIPCLDFPPLRRHFAACGSSETRQRAGMRVKRLHRQMDSFVILPSHFTNLRCELLNPQKPKGAPFGAPLASHTMPRAGETRAQELTANNT